MTQDPFETLSRVFEGRARRRTRDSQRSAVYAWENAAVPRHYSLGRNVRRDLDDVEPFVRRVWRAERGRYGLARFPVPAIRGGAGHATGNVHGLKLPPWARRSPPVILHELAHALDKRSGYGAGRSGWHGPRFVGILIGLLARHLGLDAEALMASADERGVRYDVRSIGAVPRVHLADRLADVLPATPIEAAVALGVSYRQVYGAALRLVGAGRAAWSRGRLVALAGPPRPPRGR